MSITLVTNDVLEACRLARQFELRGDYRLASEQLRYFWGGVGERPATDGLSEKESAELLLCAGRLSTWIGATDQINGAQSFARDLISEAVRLFDSPTKIAECRNVLALTYWREGDFQAAKITALNAFKDCEPDTEERAVLINTIGMLEIEQNHLHAAKQFLIRHFEEIKSEREKGNCHSQLAYVYQRLGEATEGEERADLLNLALIEYAGAKDVYEKLGMSAYCARLDNNICTTLVSIGTPGLAHPYIQRAIEYAKSARDNSLLGSFEETRAQILLAEDNLTGALVAIKSSLAHLRGGDQLALQAESETTHGAILARMGDREGAESAFDHAIELAETAQISTAKHRITKLRELMELHKSRALDYEKQLVQVALEAAGGQPTHAAALIGVSHQNFINKIRRFGLDSARTPAQTRRKKSPKGI